MREASAEDATNYCWVIRYINLGNNKYNIKNVNDN